MPTSTDYPSTVLGRFWVRFKASVMKRPLRSGILRPSEGGLVVELRHADRPPEVVVSIEWHQVQRTRAYKRDLYAVDLICLGFELADGISFEVNEEMAGWQDLLNVLPLALPGVVPWVEWSVPVAVPAFQTNETLVFERAAEFNGQRTGKLNDKRVP